MSFSGGPRVSIRCREALVRHLTDFIKACIGVRFAMIEMKTLLYFLISNFVFRLVEGEQLFGVNAYVPSNVRSSVC